MRHASTGRFELTLSAVAAIGLFTPEGERAWVPDWDPAYPDGVASETPGTVFSTAASGVHTDWVIIQIDRSSCHAAYARLTPGRHAGFVSVRISDTGPDSCAVEVAYDMTLLEGATPSLLEPYAPSEFDTVMREWRDLVEAHLHRIA